MSKMKIFFRRIHLWLSLAAGTVILTCCLTGALLVFQKELEQSFHHNRYFVQQGKQKLSLDQLIKIVKEHNAASKINGIRIYTDPERSVEVSITIPEKNENKNRLTTSKASTEKPGSRPPSLTVFVDPYNGSILDVYDPRQGFFYQVMSLHRWLLAGSDSIGKTITGISTFIFLFILITGIILWWPKTKKIFVRQLKIKRSTGWKRFNHDLHIVLGFYSFIFLFIFAFTALAWSFEWFNNGIYAVTNSPLQPPPPPKSVFVPGAKTISYDKIFEAANAVLKDAQYYNISKPRDSAAAISVTSLSKNAVHESATDVVYIDQYSAKPIGTMLFSERSAGSQVRSTFRPIHVGSIYGTPSKILAVIVCLFGASFPVTGTIMWINRLKKKKNKTKPKVFTTSAQEIM
jgi:uncharacterized iron-regulated membrane protein